MLGLQRGTLIGGAVITEYVFALPGVGRLVVDAVFARDAGWYAATGRFLGTAGGLSASAPCSRVRRRLATLLGNGGITKADRWDTRYALDGGIAGHHLGQKGGPIHERSRRVEAAGP